MKSNLFFVNILTIIFFINVVFPSANSFLSENFTRYKRQTGCASQYQFKCNSGDCISDDHYCDGTVNCKDGSDETENCKQIPCFPYSFRCKYGACINGDYECDGKTDCKDNSDETSSKCSKTSSCGTGNFRCTSGQCIKDDNLCDGKADCYDKSDETKASCGQILCPGFTFRCSYGACVNKDGRCNGRSDCIDGSDEVGCTTTTTTTKPTTQKPTVVPKNGCVLPKTPTNGRYNVSGLSSFSIGQAVSPFTVLQFSCRNGYSLYPRSNYLLICQSGINTWDKASPECRRGCSALYPTDSTDVQCSMGGKVDNKLCEEPVDGTSAKFNCREFFEPVTYFGNIAKCQGGSWDKLSYECIPVCGKRRGSAQTNVIGGKVAEKHDFPWHVGIYESKTKDHICGGSIITKTFIITAAHCLAQLDNGVAYPKEDYLVAVGKHYRNYNDKNDSDYAQFPRIKNIYVHPDYRGEIQQHDADLALIELKDSLNITAYVQPVCINWNIENRNDDLFENQTGLVIGWGYTIEDGKPSNELKVLEVPYLSRRECYKLVTDSFKPFITRDKLCAGFQNSGQSVCLGDSGGGLVFNQQYGTFDKRYFIRGIVSVSARSKTTSGCDSNSYAGYTDLTLTDYVNFIREPNNS